MADLIISLLTCLAPLHNIFNYVTLATHMGHKSTELSILKYIISKEEIENKEWIKLN